MINDSNQSTRIAESITDLQEAMGSHTDEIPEEHSKLPTSKADPQWLNTFLGYLQLGSEHLPASSSLIAEVGQFRDRYVQMGAWRGRTNKEMAEKITEANAIGNEVIQALQKVLPEEREEE